MSIFQMLVVLIFILAVIIVFYVREIEDELQLLVKMEEKKDLCSGNRCVF